jgi:hypothetical protein
MAVDVVDRNSDDFEPFEKILSQADTRTPPRVKGSKRKSVVPSPIYEDEDGEMSMDLASPVTYFGSQSVRVPANLINAGSFSRASYLSPEVDFDEVPSPRVSVPAISTSRRSSIKLNGKSPGSRLGRSRLSQSHLNPTPKTSMAWKSRVEESPGLPGDSDEDFDEGFEPPPTFEYRSRNAPPSPSPDQTTFRDLSREDEPPVTPGPDPVTPISSSRRKGYDWSTRMGKVEKPLFLPDSEDEEPETLACKEVEMGKSSKVSVAQVEPVQDGEGEELEDSPQEDVDMDYDPPIEEDFNSRRSRKLSSITEAPEPEEKEPEPMDFEQDDGLPEDQPEEPDEPPSIGPPKKRGRKKISFDENSANSQRPSKKPRSNRTPLGDRTSDSRYVSVPRGEHLLPVASLGFSF